MKKLFVITGQTATGKTKLALQYAKKINGELINADSKQIYKHLDIITGKDLDEIDSVPTHLYSIIDPKKHFSSHEWAKLASQKIANVERKGKTSIIVGGTYQYISHLLYGVETEGVKPDWLLRKKLKNKSTQFLQKLLKNISPQVLKQMNQSDRNNPRRLLRKIEIASSPHLSGTLEAKPLLKQFDVEIIGLHLSNRERFEQTIRRRVEKRLKQGAVEELKSLLKKGYKLTDPGLQANACKEIYRYLEKKITKEELIQRWVTIEMQYAKRQYTFMKKDKNIKWREV